MDDAKYGPVELPTRAWALDEVRAALAARDTTAILRAAQQHAGVSQTRLAIATGLGQGRFNEIFNGKRTVTRLDVFERIADGLTMPRPRARPARLGAPPRRRGHHPHRARRNRTRLRQPGRRST
ncbi:helix-turn-helix domain-containing protein [Actinomadura sp. 6N118]|uniref:helix-turn-helix domain-containing protein n=1 Tax=Actinomadura sp. 6N118 TaxID=3375151 RepID=UPI0037901D63